MPLRQGDQYSQHDNYIGEWHRTTIRLRQRCLLSISPTAPKMSARNLPHCARDVCSRSPPLRQRCLLAISPTAPKMSARNLPHCARDVCSQSPPLRQRCLLSISPTAPEMSALDLPHCAKDVCSQSPPLRQRCLLAISPTAPEMSALDLPHCAKDVRSRPPPLFFNIFSEDHEVTVSIGGRTITNLLVADDIDGLAGQQQELVSLVKHLDEASTAYSMQISAEKTKLMTTSNSGISTGITIDTRNLRPSIALNIWEL